MWKAIVPFLLLSASLQAETLLWSVSLGTRQAEGLSQARRIQSSGDVYKEEWRQDSAAKEQEVIGFVNQDQLQALEVLLKDPALDEIPNSASSREGRFLSLNYGSRKRTFSAKEGEKFPAIVERLYVETERALRSVKD